MPRRRKIHSLGRSENREWSCRSTRNMVAVGGGFKAALEGGPQDLINLPPQQRKLKIARMEAEPDQIRLAQASEKLLVPKGRRETPPARPRAVAERLRGHKNWRDGLLP